MPNWIPPFSPIKGNKPADWGKSPQCAKMRRKNKLRAAGLGGDKR